MWSSITSPAKTTKRSSQVEAGKGPSVKRSSQVGMGRRSISLTTTPPKQQDASPPENNGSRQLQGGRMRPGDGGYETRVPPQQLQQQHPTQQAQAKMKGSKGVGRGGSGGRGPASRSFGSFAGDDDGYPPRSANGKASARSTSGPQGWQGKGAGNDWQGGRGAPVPAQANYGRGRGGGRKGDPDRGARNGQNAEQLSSDHHKHGPPDRLAAKGNEKGTPNGANRRTLSARNNRDDSRYEDYLEARANASPAYSKGSSAPGQVPLADRDPVGKIGIRQTSADAFRFDVARQTSKSMTENNNRRLEVERARRMGAPCNQAYILDRTGLPQEQEQKDFDHSLVSVVMPGTPRQRRLESPRPMSTAFTDRSLRIREAAVAHNFTKGDAGENDDNPKHFAGCKCPVCKPFQVKAAGAASFACVNSVSQRLAGAHHTIHNKGEDDVGDDASSQCTTPRSSRGSRPGYMTPRGTRLTEEHFSGKSTDLTQIGTGSGSASANFEQSLGRKKIVRSHSVDVVSSHGTSASDWDGRAGGNPANRDIATCGKKQSISIPDDSVGYIVPREVTQSKKADGTFKKGSSPFTEKLNVMNSPTVLRLEARLMQNQSPRHRDHTLGSSGRSLSCPPEPSERGFNPVTNEGDRRFALFNLAQDVHRRAGSEMDACLKGSPASARGSQTSQDGRSGQPSSCGNSICGETGPRLAGISSMQFAERQQRRFLGANHPDVCDRPDLTPRRGARTYDSSNMEHVTKNTAYHGRRNDRTLRLATDPQFAGLCEATDRIKQAHGDTFSDLKSRIDHRNSRQTATAMVWDPFGENQR